MTALAFRTCYEFHWEPEMDVVELSLMVHLSLKAGAGSRSLWIWLQVGLK